MSAREKTKKTGDWGESVVRDFLVGHGYALIDVNWRSGRYEIDIVAGKDGFIVFVEVKTRSDNYEDPTEAVDAKKMRNLVYAADTYLRVKEIDLPYRFDIITVIGVPGRYTTEHIEDAFLPPAVMMTIDNPRQV